MGTAKKKLRSRRLHREAKQVPNLLTLPAEIRYEIFSYFLGSRAVLYKTFHGSKIPLREGRCRNGKFVPSFKFKPRVGPWDHVSKTLRGEFHSYSWQLRHLVIDNVYDLKHFIDEYNEFTEDIRALTLTLATNSREYGGYAKERADYMALLHRTFVNLTELNLYCKFEYWRSEEKAGKDDFRLMPFFQSLQPFPQLKVFRLLDKRKSLWLWPDKSPKVLSAMNNWMTGILCAKESPIQTQASHNSTSSVAERYLYLSR
jgi:hypothetical protein